MCKRYSVLLVCAVLAGCSSANVRLDGLELSSGLGTPPKPMAAPPPLNYTETGLAAWYGDKFHGRRTANGEFFDKHALTTAHKTLPFGAMVEVVNLQNGRRLVLRVNDRGPYHAGRILDVSERAAADLDFVHQGLVRVRMRYVGMAEPGREAMAPRWRLAPPATVARYQY